MAEQGQKRGTLVRELPEGQAAVVSERIKGRGQLDGLEGLCGSRGHFGAPPELSAGPTPGGGLEGLIGSCTSAHLFHHISDGPL